MACVVLLYAFLRVGGKWSKTKRAKRYLEADGSVRDPPLAFQANGTQRKLLKIFPADADGEAVHLIFPSGLTSIEHCVLRKWKWPISVAIPESVTTIREGAFEYSSLVSVTITGGVTTIENHTFRGCRSLASVTISGGVTTIEHHAFEDCSSLARVTIPDLVTKIGDAAFQGCSSLVSVTIPGGVTAIGSSTFRGCRSLVSAEIPEGVTVIRPFTFHGCNSLVSVEIPEGVTVIGLGAFQHCTSLASMKIPDGVTTIEQSVFRGCASLATVKIPEGVTTIKGAAFANCGELDGVILPKSCNVIQVTAFSSCPTLSLVVAPEALEVGPVTPFHAPGGSIADVFAACPLLRPPAYVTPYTPAAIIAAQRLEYWAPTLHARCSEQRRAWVRDALIILTRRLQLPHVVAVVVLRQLPRAQLGR